MQLISKYNKGIKYLFCVIDLFGKYAWVVPLKDKKGTSILNSSIRNPNKISVDQGNEFYNNIFKKCLKIMTLVCIQHIMKENLLLLKDLLELKKIKFTSI